MSQEAGYKAKLYEYSKKDPYAVRRARALVKGSIASFLKSIPNNAFQGTSLLLAHNYDRLILELLEKRNGETNPREYLVKRFNELRQKI